MDKTGFIQLLDKYITHSITGKERKQFSQLLKDPSYHTELEAIIDQQLAGNTFEIKEDTELGRVIFEKIQTAKQNSQSPVRKMHVWRRIAVAASVLVVVGLSAYFLLFQNKGQQPTEIVKTNLATDVEAPNTARAIITLADGRIIYLDSAANGSIAKMEGVQLVKLADGKIIYSGTTDEVVYNTLSNPKGSKVIDMTLSDGSRVWLNAGSSVTYPVAFIGNERNVSITGEAYFEIVHNAAKPFKVSKGETEVTVLGTHFNVNAYDDEADIKVTLLDGSVKVSGKNSTEILIPGQQAQVGNTMKVVSDVDMERVMAWKNGIFKFKEITIEPLMRQIEKWYDVEIVYEGKVTSHFVATIPRDVSAMNVFKILEQTGGVHFTIEDLPGGGGRKKIVVRE